MSEPRYRRTIVWFRRDLRLADNVALARAAGATATILPVFVIDPALLASERMGAPLVQAFFGAVAALRADLRSRGSELALLEGDPVRALPAFARAAGAQAVFYNEDYEPDAISRDEAVMRALHEAGVATQAGLDHVVFAAEDVSTLRGGAYRVFTPYKRAWLERYRIASPHPVPSEKAIERRLVSRSDLPETRADPRPEEFGFVSPAARPACSERAARALLTRFVAGGNAARYASARDFPALDATSHLSMHLRAGTIGIRTCVEAALPYDAFLSELVWREFYQMILKRFPYVAAGPFVQAAARIPWQNEAPAFEAWCAGATGYPIVDAAMRQLNSTGWMHNRLRMIAASFLTKDLLIDWRWGERYFERHLADADLAQNNGGWQWAASTGTDAAPYFRIFNPVVQGKRFDPEGAFVKAMLPALAAVPPEYVHAPWTMPPLLQAECRCRIGSDYPAPIVEHSAARKRALAAYAPVLGRTGGA
ncbi:MAG: cryptochrome/photolyase family protein [Vulcanimicrobiaceae bacterium]